MDDHVLFVGRSVTPECLVAAGSLEHYFNWDYEEEIDLNIDKMAHPCQLRISKELGEIKKQDRIA